MSEKNEAPSRIKTFADKHALTVASGVTIGMALWATAYYGAQAGAKKAVKNIKVNVSMLDSSGNPIRLVADI